MPSKSSEKIELYDSLSIGEKLELYQEWLTPEKRLLKGCCKICVDFKNGTGVCVNCLCCFSLLNFQRIFKEETNNSFCDFFNLFSNHVDTFSKM